MKKVLILILMAAVAFTLCSCNDTKPTATPDATKAPEETSTPTPIPVYDPVPEELTFEEFLLNPAKYNKNGMSDELAARLVEEAKAEGCILTWREDGFAALTDEETGIQIEYGEWPDNEFTDGIPAPECNFIGVYYGTDEEFVIMLDWTLEQAKAFGETVVEHGFTKVSEDIYFDEIYSFTGKNEDDLLINILQSSDEGMILFAYDTSVYGWPEEELKALFGDTEIPKIPGDESKMICLVDDGSIVVSSDEFESDCIDEWFKTLSECGFKTDDRFAVKKISDTEYIFVEHLFSEVTFSLRTKGDGVPTYEVFWDLGYHALQEDEYINEYDYSYDPESHTLYVYNADETVFENVNGYFMTHNVQESEEGEFPIVYYIMSLVYYKPEIYFYVDYADNTITARFEVGEMPEIEFFTVHYDANGGTGSMEDDTVPDVEDYEAKYCKFVNDGLYFLYWSTEPDGSGDIYHAGSYSYIFEDITLYAIWGTEEQRPEAERIAERLDTVFVSGSFFRVSDGFEAIYDEIFPGFEGMYKSVVLDYMTQYLDEYGYVDEELVYQGDGEVLGRPCKIFKFIDEDFGNEQYFYVEIGTGFGLKTELYYDDEPTYSWEMEYGIVSD